MNEDIWVTRQTLLMRVKDKSDEQAWLDFDSYYTRYLYNILRRMNISPTDAQDISQQVLMKLWKKLPDFKLDSHRGKFRSWLATVVRNQALDFLKANQRHDHVDLSSLDSSSSQTEIEKFIDIEWQNSIIEKAWDKIKEEFEEKTLKAFELSSSNMSTEEIALKLDISKPSVYSYKSRVKERLKEEVRRLNHELG